MHSPGLSRQEASRLLAQYGHNELPATQPKTLLRIVAEVMRELMIHRANYPLTF